MASAVGCTRTWYSLSSQRNASVRWRGAASANNAATAAIVPRPIHQGRRREAVRRAATSVDTSSALSAGEGQDDGPPRVDEADEAPGSQGNGNDVPARLGASSTRGLACAGLAPANRG